MVSCTNCSHFQDPCRCYCVCSTLFLKAFLESTHSLRPTVVFFCFVLFCLRTWFKSGHVFWNVWEWRFHSENKPKNTFSRFQRKRLEKQQSPTNHRIIENVRTPTQDLYSFCVFKQGVHWLKAANQIGQQNVTHHFLPLIYTDMGHFSVFTCLVLWCSGCWDNWFSCNGFDYLGSMEMQLVGSQEIDRHVELFVELNCLVFVNPQVYWSPSSTCVGFFLITKASSVAGSRFC